MSTDPVEIEVKFHVDDMSRVRARLEALGASSDGERFETNFRYDDKAGRLLAAQCLLRLRRDRQVRLTFKRPRPDHGREFKVYDEYEVCVEDFDGMHRILTALGFERVQTYEKRREVFPLEDVLVCVDRLPYGDFIEIEGAPARIRETARRLEFPWERRILANYLHIFETLRRCCGLNFNDVTFANLPEAPPGARAVIQQFQAAAAP
ncbi:MAG: class IV adenylate cyclase [Desulfobacterales bacterium]|nr:class IV adenylate cyclase [Desulfobacterales bacterium]MDJ0855159.1 class IV adenylate cyclase [Desulfobacterales bacterium]MDJ0874767.1 class IV adenylate cyclase [Desulfobacterales bacterium]MDJ0888764.1 class IV adenylate cyclase [Desulfobacterales bacterium]